MRFERYISYFVVVRLQDIARRFDCVVLLAVNRLTSPAAVPSLKRWCPSI